MLCPVSLLPPQTRSVSLWFGCANHSPQCRLCSCPGDDVQSRRWVLTPACQDPAAWCRRSWPAGGTRLSVRAKGCRTGPAAALCLRQRCPRAPIGAGVILQEGVRRHHLLVPLLPGRMVLSRQGGVCDLSLVKDDGWRRHSWSPAVNRFVPEVQEK